MKFTKEYIELCKNEMVQGLKHKLEKGDWYMGSKEPILIDRGYTWGNLVEYPWLPTGDQLDDEIVNIAGYKGWYYTACYYPDDYEYEILIEYEDDDMCLNSLHRARNKNPLIAKIEILINLLEY